MSAGPLAGQPLLVRALAALAVVQALAGFGVLLLWHLWTILADAPMEMRDGAVLATTIALLDGRNPYALPGLAMTGNVYGIVYPLSVLPFALLLGPGFLAHHLATAAAVWGACFLLWRWLRVRGVARTDALLGCLMVYAGLIYFTGAAARPDGIGVLLMFAALAVMERGEFSARAFAAGLGLSLLAMLAKIYFVWPAFAGASYVFLCRDLRRGFAYGVSAIIATAAAWALIGLVAPGYVAVVLMANLGATTYEVAHLVRQIREWSLFSLPLLAAGAMVLAMRARAGTLRLGGRDPGLMAAMLGFGCVAILGALGGHTGAHLSYLFQLVSPFLAVVVLVAARREPWAVLAFRLSLPIAIVLNAHWFMPPGPARSGNCALAAFEPEAAIASGRRVLATTELAGQLALARQPLAETGHAEYLDRAALATPPAWLRPFVPPQAALAAEWNGLLQGIRDNVAARRYEVIYIGRHPSPLIPRALIAEHYQGGPVPCTNTSEGRAISASLPGAVMPWAQQVWPFEVWTPKP